MKFSDCPAHVNTNFKNPDDRNPAQVREQQSAVVSALVRDGVVDMAAVERARRAAEAGDARLDHALTRLGLVPDQALARAYAEVLGLDPVEETDFPEMAVLDDILPTGFLERVRMLPLADDAESLRLAVVDPFDRSGVDAVALKTGKKISVCIINSAEFERAFRRLYGAGSSSDLGDLDQVDQADVEQLMSIASDAPVIRLVDRVIAAAVEMSASDIHFSAKAGGLRIRYRVDGMLRDAEEPPAGMRAAIISRLKIMAGLNIAEMRLPQDGRIRVVARGREIDLRISVMPTIEGEGAVVRILDQGLSTPDLATLGFSPDLRQVFEELLALPHGVVLVTGPTGSGKTTTLYAALRRLNRPDWHVITVEDPVEYRLAGINQIQIKPGIGLDFPDALRSVLRHDPDILMIGEMRDTETARIGLQAALTGHPVLATLHTNDALSALPRLLDMGVEAYLVAAVVNGVAAQRLVRALCEKCKEPYSPSPEVLDGLRKRVPEAEVPARLWRGKGCPACGNTGYRGRALIAEILKISEEIRHILVEKPELSVLRRQAEREGMRTMFSDGLTKAGEGKTSLEELFRAVGSV